MGFSVDVFGASIVLRNNVSGVLRQAQNSARGFRGAVNRARQEMQRLDQQRLRDRELRIRTSAAYQAVDRLRRRMEPISRRVINVVAHTQNAIDGVRRVRQHLAKIKDNKVVKLVVKGAEGALKALGKGAVVGTAAAFTAVTAASGIAVKSAVDYQAQMKNVGTLLDGDINSKLKKYSSQLLAVSNDTGIASSDLTDGLYQVVSAFGESAENVKQLEIAAKAAKAGNATTTDSVNLLSSVTKAYGDTSAEAMQKASDLAFLTVKLGQTSFPELAASMGGAIAMGSQLGVTQEALYGTMATLTGVTGNTAEVSTQLEGVLAGFLSPTDKLSKALKNMGYSSGAAALEAEGLEGVILKLKDQVGGSSLDLANLFSDKSAKQAVLGLTGDLADTWHEKTAAMMEAGGATEAAFATQQSSLKAMVQKVKNFGQNMLTSVGEKALPYIEGALQKLIDKMPQFEAAMSGIADKVGPGIERLGSILSDVWTAWQPVLQQLGTDFGAAFEQVKPCIQGVLDSFGGIVPYIQPVVSAVGSTLAAMIPVVGGIFEGISSVVSAVFPVVAQIVTDIGGKIQAVFGKIGGHAGVLSEIFQTVGPAIASVLSTAWSIISPVLDLALAGIELIGTVMGAVFPQIQSVIEAVWNVIGPVLEKLGSAIKSVADGVQGAVEKVKGFFGGKNVDANATGTNYYGGGWTTVGEHGPELMHLPSGTKIKSNSDSKSMIRRSDSDRKGWASENYTSSPSVQPEGRRGETAVFASGGTDKTTTVLQQTPQPPKRGDINITIQNMEVKNDADIERIAEELIKKIEEAEENM
ncbi:MAG: phage tail tape measure protein [Lachnospiraceae bacterium]|nr:phage tail tape measure protein [Lachnospiraceae bacterium]